MVIVKLCRREKNRANIYPRKVKKTHFPEKMPPHTCECRICGSQWRRAEHEIVAIDAFVEPALFQSNQKLLMTVGVSRARNKNDSMSGALDAFSQLSATIDKNSEARHPKCSDNSTEIEDNKTSKEQINPDQTAKRVTRSSINSKNIDDFAQKATTRSLQISENVSDGHHTESVKVEQEGTCSQNVVKEVTAMLDNDLVIPETEIITEQEVVLEMESGGANEETLQENESQLEIMRANKENNKTESDMNDLMVKLKCTDSKTSRRSIVHNMPESIFGNKLQCSVCGLAFLSLMEYNEHASGHVPIQQRADHKCYICNKVMTRDRYLLKHLETHKGSNPYRCDFSACKKGFESQDLLDVHWSHIHGSETSVFRCAICGKECKKNSELVVHMRVHTDERPYVCNVEGCDMKFKQPGTLKVHTRQHTGETPFQCDLCGKSFRQISNYREHQAKHKPESKKCASFLCVYCGKAYKKMYQLNEHMRQHTGDTLQCKLCDRTFALKASLRNHMLTHQETRVEYKCDHCGRRFLSKQACKQHQSLHGDSAFKCDQCHKHFINATVLKQHTDRIHKGSKKFACSKCGKKLATAWSLSKHLNNHSRHDVRLHKRQQLIQAMKEKDSPSPKIALLREPYQHAARKLVTVKPMTQFSNSRKMKSLLNSQSGNGSTSIAMKQGNAIGQPEWPNQNSALDLGVTEVTGEVTENTEQMESLLELAETAVSMSCALSDKLMLTLPETNLENKDCETKNVVPSGGEIVLKPNSAIKLGDVLYVLTEDN